MSVQWFEQADPDAAAEAAAHFVLGRLEDALAGKECATIALSGGSGPRGLFTRLAAFILAGEMAFAYFMEHAPQGFYPALNKGLPAVLFCFVFLYLSAAAGGPWSLDRIIRRVG